MPIKKITRIAIAVCIITICSWITIPFAIPFTLQTFAIFFVLLCLGGKEGICAIGAYILLGAVGLPVFSGFRGGVGHIAGPTGGYIVGFLLVALVYILAEAMKITAMKYKVISLCLGLTLCYGAGTLWFVFGIASGAGEKTKLVNALLMCVVPYIIPDIIKLFLAATISKRVKKTISAGR